ncbi:acetate--CoA ligase family protein [Marivirga arenosa]|uniref:Acetate--CoA ligase family protein n=1 Tax=Marivirga arenosa TaxID=3059076 RepID=A0AA51X4R0_9BACT|nr:acetate--CoA ligase family protein [Marivirga sp. BKB1-2]WNB16936.1 acetate--CoA ligase family protein [Marivirga sp. BKB1-2]
MPFDNKFFDQLFNPKSIAVIGASTHTDKVGYALLKNLLNGGFTGKIYPVNPNTNSILGLKAYSSVEQINNNVDLAIIAVDAVRVPDILNQAYKKGIKTFIIITAGFKESTSIGAKVLEEKLVEVVYAHELFVIGPNCLGVINTQPTINMNATFARVAPKKGNIAFVSQSGAIGIHALEYAARQDIGFSKFVTIGNKTAINENDLLNYLIDDEETKVILLYLESFSDGIRFKEIIQSKNQQQLKPIIILKSGRTESGIKAALSHTGALTGEDNIVSQFLDDCGVLRVDSIEELFTTALLIANQPKPKGNKLLVLTNAGGLGIMAMDATKDTSLVAIKLMKPEQDILQKELPNAASTANPVDILGDAGAERYSHTLKTLLDINSFDLLLMICTPQFMTNRAQILNSILDLVAKARKNQITLAAVFPSINEELFTIFDAYDLPNYEFPEQAINAFSNYVRFANYKFEDPLVQKTKLINRKYNHLKKLFDKAKHHNQEYLNEVESYSILKEYGVTLAPHYVTKHIGEAISLADKIGYPVVAKIIAKGVLHKFDQGGVILNINTKTELIEAYNRLYESFNSKRVEGVLIQSQIKKGIEFIIGSKFHEGFGHFIMFGLGGTYVEILKDIKLAMSPLTKVKAYELIESIRAKEIMEGYRGIKPINKEALVNLLLKVSNIVNDFPEIESLDLNPVFALENDAIVADARIILKKQVIKK